MVTKKPTGHLGRLSPHSGSRREQACKPTQAPLICGRGGEGWGLQHKAHSALSNGGGHIPVRSCVRLPHKNAKCWRRACGSQFATKMGLQVRVAALPPSLPTPPPSLKDAVFQAPLTAFPESPPRIRKEDAGQIQKRPAKSLSMPTDPQLSVDSPPPPESWVLFSRRSPRGNADTLPPSRPHSDLQAMVPPSLWGNTTTEF